jgi:hypothetical protein
MRLTRMITPPVEALGVTRFAAAVAAVTLAAGLTAAAAAGSFTGRQGGGPAGSPAAHVNGQAAGCTPASVASGMQAAVGSCAGSAASAAQQQVPADVTVTLITGDKARLVTAPDGQQSVSVAGHAGTGKPDSSLFVPFSYGGDEYLFPASAVPYLGSVLDPRLFDVSYLARAGLADNRSGTIPVTVTYSGSSPPAVPGLHLAHAAAGVAAGTISKANAPALGALLARQSTAAADRHVAAQLPGITHIALAQPKGAPPLPAAPLQAVAAAPGGSQPAPAAGSAGPPGWPGSAPPYRTLRLAFTSPSASTSYVLGAVQNVGDSRLDSSLGAAATTGGLAFSGVVLALTGRQSTWQVSVPQGTYSAEFVFLTPHSGTFTGFDGALVADPQFTVGAGTTTVSLDASHAVPYSASVRGINAPPVRVDELSFTRSAVRGPAAYSDDITDWFDGLLSVSGDGYAGSVLSAAPTAPVTEGEFMFDAFSYLESVAQFNSGPPDPSPTYILDFPTQGRIPPSLTYTVPQSQLTTVHTQTYQSSSGAYNDKYRPFSPPGSDCFTSGRYDLVDFWLYDGSPPLQSLEVQFAVTDGTDHTDYVYEASPRVGLLQPVIGADDCSDRVAAPLQVHPGQQVTEVWNKEPLVPGPALAVGNGFGLAGQSFQTGPFPAACTACRQDDNAFLSLTDWGDSDPGHYGIDSSYYVPAYNDLPWADVFNQMDFYRDGMLTVTSKGSCFLPIVGSGKPGCSMAPQGLDLPLLPRPASYRLDWSYPRGGDPAAVTDTVWDFTSAPASGTPLSGNLQCAPDPARGCTFLPLLFLTYDLALNQANRATAGGPFQISFTVEHQQGQAPPAGVSAIVSASFDNGTTWTAPVAATSRGGNRFTATIQQPPLSSTSGFASLRVTAKDGAGNTVTQTIIKAYGLTS